MGFYISAPDITGQNIANPIACFWTAKMMLDHLEEIEASSLLMNAIEQLTAEGKILTRDLELVGDLFLEIKMMNFLFCGS